MSPHTLDILTFVVYAIWIASAAALVGNAATAARRRRRAHAGAWRPQGRRA